MIAARNVQLFDASAQVPLPGLASTVSAVLLTVNDAARAGWTETISASDATATATPTPAPTVRLNLDRAPSLRVRIRPDVPRIARPFRQPPALIRP